ncbi:MAG TPA: hypothetical protein VJ879_12395 [Desulfobacter sp.]|nr:hypothetical protein [Desulfobacter sp.]
MLAEGALATCQRRFPVERTTDTYRPIKSKHTEGEGYHVVSIEFEIGVSAIQIKDILFIRQHPRQLGRNVYFRQPLKSVMRSRGATTHYAGHNITFLVPGYGKLQHLSHPAIIEKLDSGQITDIVDIGGGGALDPSLKRGDLVLSVSDIPYDTLQPLPVKRRQEIPRIVQAIADQRKNRFFEANILTSHEIIASKKKRAAVHEETNCAVVQMEHCWFLRTLKNIMRPESFNRLHVTHIEIVADVVPKHDSVMQHFTEICHGLDYCFLRNQQNIGTIKSDFLALWLKRESSE